MQTKLTKTKAGQYILHNVRIAYPDLYTAVPFKNDPKNTPRFGVTVLVPKEAEEVIDKLTAEINKLAKEKHKLNKLAAADSCFQDGDEKSNEALQGHMLLSTYAYPNEKSANGGAPQVLDRGKRPIAKGASNAPYSGCYANVLFDLYAPSGWKKVSAGLKVVQVIADGEPIGAATDTSELPELDDEELGEDGESFE